MCGGGLASWVPLWGPAAFLHTTPTPNPDLLPRSPGKGEALGGGQRAEDGERCAGRNFLALRLLLWVPVLET